MTGSPVIGMFAGILAGAVISLLFGFLTLTLVANQVATGLALTILGLGLSGMLGEPYVGVQGIKMADLAIPGLSDIVRDLIVGALVAGGVYQVPNKSASAYDPMDQIQ